MVNYRRLYVPGGTCFFTLVTHNRRPILTSELARTCLRRAWTAEQQRRPFQSLALCLLPEHLHCMMTLPEDDDNFSVRVQKIKAGFTRLYLRKGGIEAPVTLSKQNKKERGIWQRRFWEHGIRDENDFGCHLDYIHYNPVKHGLVTTPKLWFWSTFHRYVRMGWYDADWGETERDQLNNLTFGEQDGSH